MKSKQLLAIILMTIVSFILNTGIFFSLPNQRFIGLTLSSVYLIIMLLMIFRFLKGQIKKVHNWVCLTAILNLLFVVPVIYVLLNNNSSNSLLFVITLISFLLSILNSIYLISKFKSKAHRTLTKKRIVFNVLNVILLFGISIFISNKDLSINTLLYIASSLISLSSIYYINIIFSYKDIFNFKDKILKLLDLLSYVRQQRNSNIVLLDTPIHSNLGDSAIALAEKEYLKKLLNINYIVEVTAEQLDGMEKYYALFTSKKKTVLVHGGGFLGDIWPNEENRFRRIITSFKSNKIVVLPQTIHYDLTNERSKTSLEESKSIYSSHKDLTIFAREKKSYKFLKEHYKNTNVYLVPDIVTTLDIPDINFKREGILFCMRSDLEKIVKKDEEKALVQIVKNKYPKEKITYTDTVIDKDVLIEERTKEIHLKLNEFAKSKLVITDRLHGMVFAALTNTPCIALGNSSGKVKGVYEWIKENDYVCYLDRIEEFEVVLKKLDINKTYKYKIEKIEEYFKPLVEVLKKDDKYGRKSN